MPFINHNGGGIQSAGDSPFGTGAHASAENDLFRFGPTLSPLTDSTDNTLFEDVDTSLRIILRFYEQMIKTHLGDRWDAEVALAKRTDLVGRVVAEAVGGFDPMPYFQEAQFSLPLLSVYRSGTETYDRQAGWLTITSPFHVLWTMPPMTLHQTQRLVHFRTHVARVIFNRTMDGFDSRYNDGELVWQTAQLQSITIKQASYGNIPDAKNNDLNMPSVLIEGELVERSMNLGDSQYEPFEGTDNIVSSPVPIVVEAAAEFEE